MKHWDLKKEDLERSGLFPGLDFLGSYSTSFCFLSSLTKKTEFLKKEPKNQHQKYSLEQS